MGEKEGDRGRVSGRAIFRLGVHCSLAVASPGPSMAEQVQPGLPQQLGRVLLLSQAADRELGWKWNSRV